jgi:hypothetical protein
VRIENSFIPVRGVGEKTEHRLWDEGVTHWDEFDPSVVGSTTADRIRAFIEEARPHLESGNGRFFGEAFPGSEAWRLYENFRDGAAFFDIETTGLSKERDEVTTVSVHRGGETETLVRGQDLTRERLADALDAPLLVTFNGASFDIPFLERSFDLSLDTAHLDLRYPCRSVGLTGGLKSIEREVGIDRDRPDLSGYDAVRLWRRYERQGDEDALDTLVSYNREDTVNLRTVADEATRRLHEDRCGGLF